MSHNNFNIGPSIKIGIAFAIGGLHTIFWYFITGLFFLYGWKTRSQLLISAMLWSILKITELAFLFTASRLNDEIFNKKWIDLSKNRILRLKVLIVFFVIMNIIEFIFFYNRGFWWPDWVANIVQFFLLLNLAYILNRLSTIDLKKLQNAYEEISSETSI